MSVVAGEGKVTATMTARAGGTPTSYNVTAYTTAGVAAGTCPVTVAPWSCDEHGWHLGRIRRGGAGLDGLSHRVPRARRGQGVLLLHGRVHEHRLGVRDLMPLPGSTDGGPTTAGTPGFP